MKKIFVLVSFVKLSVNGKIAFYRNVIAKMTGNSRYPSPDVTLANAATVVNTLETAEIAAKDGSHTAVSAMHDAEKKADDIFYKLADYVNRIANGDETAILSSGFEPSAQPAASQKAPLTATNGTHTGGVKLTAKAVEKAGSYSWQMAKDSLPATEDGWTIIGQTTAAFFEKEGLTPGGKYFFRVEAITPTGITNYTDPVAKIIE
jgi:antitoxin (DNA-binding transcriptional repressor) of toxin-antitoxin stability system